MRLTNKLEVDNKEKEKMKQVDKELIVKALNHIQERLDFRNAIFRFETYLAFKSWEEDKYSLITKGENVRTY